MEELDYELEGCRTCGVFSPLQFHYLRQLFGKDRDSNADNILALLRSWNIQVEENDGLPQYICTQCILQLSETYKVQKSCLQVQEELRHWYFKEMPVVHIKEEIGDDNEDYDISESHLEPFDNSGAILENNVRAHDEVLLIPANNYYLPNQAAQVDNNIPVNEFNNAAHNFDETIIQDNFSNEAKKISDMRKICLNEEQKDNSMSDKLEFEYENQEEFYTSDTILCCICHKEFENEAEHDTHYWTAHAHEVEMILNRNSENPAEHSFDKDYVNFTILDSETPDVSADNDKNYETNETKNPFKCHLCTKSFSLQFSLNRHMKRHKMS